jgi:hypothetical protein
LYHFGDVDDLDINKLFGRSFGLHHKNSVRFGWRIDGNKIAIYSYSYVNGQRISNMITKCSVEKEYKFTMTTKDKLTILEVDCDSYKIRYGVETGGSNFGYKLYPYFGGNKTAPHDLTIYLD